MLCLRPFSEDEAELGGTLMGRSLAPLPLSVRGLWCDLHLILDPAAPSFPEEELLTQPWHF